MERERERERERKREIQTIYDATNIPLIVLHCFRSANGHRFEEEHKAV